MHQTQQQLHPAELAFRYLREMNTMLFENWKRVLAMNPTRHGALRNMRVRGGVATVCNKEIIIRHPAPTVPDGFYPVVESCPRVMEREFYWMRYPDVDIAIPNLEAMMSRNPPYMDNATVGEFLSFVSSSKNRAGCIEIRRDCARVPPTLHHPEGYFNFPFSVPSLLTFSFDLMEMALKEAIRYSHVCFAAEPPHLIAGTSDSTALPPLFIGGYLNGVFSWDHCIMVLPENATHLEGRGPYS